MVKLWRHRVGTHVCGKSGPQSQCSKIHFSKIAGPDSTKNFPHAISKIWEPYEHLLMLNCWLFSRIFIIQWKWYPLSIAEVISWCQLFNLFSDWFGDSSFLLPKKSTWAGFDIECLIPKFWKMGEWEVTFFFRGMAPGFLDNFCTL